MTDESQSASMAQTTLEYEPDIIDHPAYTPDIPEDLEVGAVVNLLAYNGVEVLRENGTVVGQKRYLTDEMCEQYERGETDLIRTNHVVRELDDDMHRVRVSLNGLTPTDSTSEWVPLNRVVGRDPEAEAQLEARRQREREREKAIEDRKETDLDALMDEVIIPHAREKVEDVWPGGTVDVDEISWFWNTRLSRCAGKAYYGTAVPQIAGDDADIAIGLAPDYYYQHGLHDNGLLAVVRHELVHAWQYNHPDSNGGGHGPKFKQWLGEDDMDTHRHCKHW